MRLAAQRIEGIGDLLAEEIGDRRHAVRPVVRRGEGRAVGQRSGQEVARPIVGQRYDERACGRGDVAGKQPLPRVVAELRGDPVWVDHSLGQPSRQVLGDLSSLVQRVSDLSKRAAGVISKPG